MDADPLENVRAASLSDAMRALHPHRHHVLDLVSPTPGRILFGRVATMLFAPLRADVPKEAQNFEKHLAAARDAQQDATVLVCAAPGAEDAAMVGGVRLAQVSTAGFAGVLTTARMRDFTEAGDSGLTLFCRGETPFAGSAQAMPVATNIPIALDGATVIPGDFVYADDAGAIIIPAKDIHAVIERAAKIEADDAVRVRKALGR